MTPLGACVGKPCNMAQSGLETPTPSLLTLSPQYHNGTTFFYVCHKTGYVNRLEVISKEFQMTDYCVCRHQTYRLAGLGAAQPSTHGNLVGRTRTDENGRARTIKGENGRARTIKGENGRKRTRTGENGRKRLRTDGNRRERKRTEENGRERTKTDGNGRERTRTDENGRERTGTDGNGRKHIYYLIYFLICHINIYQ